MWWAVAGVGSEMSVVCVLGDSYADTRDRHVRTPSFPTLRSADLGAALVSASPGAVAGFCTRGWRLGGPTGEGVRVHGGPEAVRLDVGIDLRRADVGMAEHLLEAAQIRAMVEEVRGEGVAHHVRRHRGRVQPGFERHLVQQLAQSAPGQVTVPARRGKQPWRRRPAAQEVASDGAIGFQRGDRSLVEGGDALLPPLAPHEQDGCDPRTRSEEHTSELQSLMHISYAVFGLNKKIDT